MILLFLGALIFSPRVHAAPPLDEKAAFHRLSFATCRGKDQFLGQEAAAEMMRKIRSGKMDLDVFLDTYSITCDRYESAKIAVEAKEGKIDIPAFRASYRLICKDESHGQLNINQINMDERSAKEIAEKVSEKKVDLDFFLKTFTQICDYPLAKRIAEEEKAGKLNQEAFQKVVFYYCHGNNKYIHAKEAEDIAEKVALNTINLSIFQDTYYKGCDFAEAKRLAK